MDKFTVKITFRSGKQKIITNVNTLTYDIEFINNKWILCLMISQNQDNHPAYYSYKSTVIDKVLILNKKRIIVVDDKLAKSYAKRIKELKEDK